MGKASVPKRGRTTGKTRPLRSDNQPRGMPTIVLNKGKSKKLKVVVTKKKANLKATKAKPVKAKSMVENEDSDTASVASARGRRNAADHEASTSKSANEPEKKVSKKPQRAAERSESPAPTRLSRSSSANSVVGKSTETKKTGKGNVDKGKGKSPVTNPKHGIMRFFPKRSLPSKGSAGNKAQDSKKEVENDEGDSQNELIVSVNSSPDSVNSGSSRSTQIASDRLEVNDDDSSALDDDESCVGSHVEDIDSQNVEKVESSSKSVNGNEGGSQKFIPKLTKKNINELFPSDDSSSRLRSGSPASQKSTRSLSLQRISPKAPLSSRLSFTTQSESGIRALRNGKLKRATMPESVFSGSKKKKRVYAGMINNDDKIEDSRSDFSDEQSSIFSESDSSSFIDAFSRVKNHGPDDKMDSEDIPGSMSNDEDDILMGRISSPAPQLSPIEKSAPESRGKGLPCETSSAPEDASKSREILNNIQSDWDSDGETNIEDTDAIALKSPKEGHSAFDELLSNSSSLPPLTDKDSSCDGKIVEKSDAVDSLQDASKPIPSESDGSTNDEKQDSRTKFVEVNSVSKSDEKEDSEDNSDVKQDTVHNSSTPSDSTMTSIEESPSNSQLSTEPDNMSADSSSKIPEPIVLKTNDGKNGFATSVDFVAKKNTRIDFELLRRRTKRSMSFNTELPEKNQSQRILAVEPNKLHGKSSLVWTVKAVREPIIPKTVTSPEKGLPKSDNLESKTTSNVKPMMESIQNDNQSIPKPALEAVLTSAPPSVNSSSVKENILVQKSPKQSPGRSPVSETLPGVIPKSPTSSIVKATSEIRYDNSVNGVNEPREKNAVSNGMLTSATDSTLAATVKQPSDVEAISSKISKSGDAAVPVESEGDISVVTAAKTSIEENFTNSDSNLPNVVTKKNDEGTEASEATNERCNTPEPCAIQMDTELTPDRAAFDDGESFCLRLSPTPTKEDCNQSNHSLLITPVKEVLSSVGKEPSPTVETNNSASKDLGNCNESLSDILEDLEARLPEEKNNSGIPVTNAADVSSRPEKPILQLVIKKSLSRPRSLSADCNPSALAFMNDDIWVVKNNNDSSVQEEHSMETDVVLKTDENVEDAKENVPENCQGILKEAVINSTTENQVEISEAIVKSNDSSNMTIECSTIPVKQPGLLSPRLEADVERLNLKLNDIEKKRREITEEEQSPEKKAIKEWVLSSLGLQSVAAAAAAAASNAGRPSKRRSQDGLIPSSGRLKAVIKVPKDGKKDKKGNRKPLRMVFKNGKVHSGGIEDAPGLGGNSDADPSFRIEGTAGELSGASMLHGQDFAANGVLLEEATTSGAEADGKGKPGTNLVIPEKSSSFSIHPGRLCSDVCSYCFGKFGLLDTPCHVAQLKGRERQMKIMSVETHLALDSCLCDACIRHVDRKAHYPSSKPPTSHRKEGKGKFEGSMATCSVISCAQPARHTLRKKWYLKIRKSVIKKCPIDLELVQQHLPLPLCPEHFSYMEYFMVCGLCKRRLSRSHMYNLSNTSEINVCLERDGIPARLSENLFVCKLCRYYSTLQVKHPGAHINLSSNQQVFLHSYRKRILRNHEVDVSDSEEDGGAEGADVDEDASAEESTTQSSNFALVETLEENLPKGKRKRAASNASIHLDTTESTDLPKKKSRHSDQSSKSKEKSEMAKMASSGRSRDREAARETVPPVTISVSDTTQGRSHKVGRPPKPKPENGNEFIRKGLAPFYPSEDELALHGKLHFQSDDEPSVNRAWEKCTSTLQFDKDTKKLWQELQRPYGSQSSFLRHLVLMERYWREGELVLAADASAKATSYTRSVQNRLKAYGSTITVKSTPLPLPPPTPTPSPYPVQGPAGSTPTLAATLAAPPPPVPIVAAVPAVPAVPVKDLALALTGGTVLTAAAAAAAVTAVLSSSLSPSGEAGSTPRPQQTQQVQQKQPAKPLGKAPPGKSQQVKGQQWKVLPNKTPQDKIPPGRQVPSKVQPVVQMKPLLTLQKPQAPQAVSQPALQVTSVIPAPVKTSQAVPLVPPVRLTVKPPTPVQEVSPAPKQTLSHNQLAISIAGHSLPISTPISMTSAVTITPEPSVKSTLDKSPSVLGKLQPILPKPPIPSKSPSSSSSFTLGSRGNSSSWEATSPPSNRPQFLPMSSSPVVNLTRSISLTAVPSSPPSVPDLHPINSIRPNRSPSTSLPLSSNSITVTTSRASPGAPSASLPMSSSSITVTTSRAPSFVSIVPTPPSKPTFSKPSTSSFNKPASITPIYTSQSLPSPVTVTSSAASSVTAPSVVVVDNEPRVPPAGKVHVTAGGKSFSLTITQFKKLQALRQQRQQEQQNKLKRQAAKQVKEKKVFSSAVTSMSLQDDLEVVEVHDADNDMQHSPLPTISAVVSGDQAKAMWSDESRLSESDSSMSISVSSPVLEISPIIAGKPDITVESLPKIPKALTVTQIRKESPTLPKTVSTSGLSALTITRQKCQTPMAPQMSTQALDIFPS